MTHRVQEWMDTHAITAMGAALVTFFVLLAYVIWTKGDEIQAACESANEVRKELRGLMADFRQQTLMRQDLQPEEIGRRVAGYDQIIDTLHDKDCG